MIEGEKQQTSQHKRIDFFSTCESILHNISTISNNISTPCCPPYDSMSANRIGSLSAWREACCLKARWLTTPPLTGLSGSLCGGLQHRGGCH